jgi:hypothetical protein
MEGGRAHQSGPQEGKKNGPISGAIIKRLDGGLIQEWRRRAAPPVGTAKREISKKQVKVIYCQRPLLLLLYEALAHPNWQKCRDHDFDAFKALQ